MFDEAAGHVRPKRLAVLVRAVEAAVSAGMSHDFSNSVPFYAGDRLRDGRSFGGAGLPGAGSDFGFETRAKLVTESCGP